MTSETVGDRVAVLALVPSSTQAGAYYTVTEEHGAALCSCPAFRFARAELRTCKHLAALWAALNGESSPPRDVMTPEA